MLDAYFRKYAWIANAALLVAAAWLTARTVNTVVATVIRPRPQVDLAALPAAAPAGPVASTLAAERLYPLLGLTPPRPQEVENRGAPPPPATPQNCFDARAVPTRTALRLQMVAGVIAERPEWSIASLTDLTTRETRVYGVGDNVQGATLLRVDRVRDPRDGTGSGYLVVAVICNGGTKEYVDFGAEQAGPATAFAPAPAAAPPGDASGNPDLSGVRKVGENRYELPKRVVDQSLSNLNTLATQARIVPSFKNGVANGFKLFSIQPGSLYSAIGVENGDVIQRINGYEINSPDKALEIYQKLREASHLTIELERNGRLVKNDYNIGGP